jgi:hypothetical protein
LISYDENIGGGRYLQPRRIDGLIDGERRRPRLGALAGVRVGKGDGEWPVGAGARVFALAFTVKVTTVPEDDTLPEIAEGVSQLGYPEIA